MPIGRGQIDPGFPGDSADNARSTIGFAIGTGFVALDVVVETQTDAAPIIAAGGSCGNVMAILAYLGWDAYPVARIGYGGVADLVRDDLSRAGVCLDLAGCEPLVETPVVVQVNYQARDGSRRHRFLQKCPDCGAWLPSYRPVTEHSVRPVIEMLEDAAQGGVTPNVCFFDRVSRGALALADACSRLGAVVMFEPSGQADEGQFMEAIEVSHIVKYASDRLAKFETLLESARRAAPPLLEVMTDGAAGLRFRHSRASATGRGRRSGNWRHLRAIPVPTFRDSAGAGDWCSAGLLSLLGGAGTAGIASATIGEVEHALRYGQAAAALACGFPGARGVAMAMSANELRGAIDRMLHQDSSEFTLNETSAWSASKYRGALGLGGVATERPYCLACT
jgi:sugar/nucleoside kinase (ribokinase family)